MSELALKLKNVLMINYYFSKEALEKKFLNIDCNYFTFGCRLMSDYKGVKNFLFWILERTRNKSIQAHYLNIFNDILNDLESEFIIHKNDIPAQIPNFSFNFEKHVSFYPPELKEKERLKQQFEQQLKNNQLQKFIQETRNSVTQDYGKKIGLLKQLREAIENYTWRDNVKLLPLYLSNIELKQEKMTPEQLKETVHGFISKAKTKEAMESVATWAHANNQEQLKDDIHLL